MTNTYMLAGPYAPEEIIRSVDRGIYAVNFGGGQVDITSGKFVFSVSEAYLIENGKLGAPIKGATLIGNGPDVLTRVAMVGQRPEARCRRRHLRQGRAERAGRRGPADAARRRPDRGRNRVATSRARMIDHAALNQNVAHPDRRVPSTANASSIAGRVRSIAPWHACQTIYESLPGLYAALGAALLWVSYRYRDERWSTACAVAGLRRRGRGPGGVDAPARLPRDQCRLPCERGRSVGESADEPP